MSGAQLAADWSRTASAWGIGFSSTTSPGFGHVTGARFPDSEQKHGAPLEALIRNGLRTAAAPRLQSRSKNCGPDPEGVGEIGSTSSGRSHAARGGGPSPAPSRSSSCWSLLPLGYVACVVHNPKVLTRFPFLPYFGV